MTKTCSRCRRLLPIEAFTKDRGRRDGLNPQCGDCTRANGRKWHQGNSESVAARKAADYRANRERFLERNSRWRAENKERESETNRRYYHINKDRVAEWHRLYYEANKEAALVACQRRRARLAAVPTIQFTPEQLAARWAYYGNKCWICGESATQTDHVKPIAKGGAHMLCNLRPACGPCNASKRDKWPYFVEIRAA